MNDRELMTLNICKIACKSNQEALNNLEKGELLQLRNNWQR